MLQHEIDDCVAAAEQLGGSLGPWEALSAWVKRYVAFVATKQGLAGALHSGDPAYEGLPDRLAGQLEPAVQRLLDQAMSGRPEERRVTARELITTVSLLSRHVPRLGSEFNPRVTSIFLTGLRHS